MNAIRKGQNMKIDYKKYLVNIWNVPNVLTMLRMALIPVFVLLYVNGHPKAALVTFLAASFTDFLDGYIARKYHLITDFGKLMDPLADKLMVCTAMICQAAAGVFPWVAVAIVMGKELLMVWGAMKMLEKGVVVYANIWGKLATCSFILALTLSFFHGEIMLGGVAADSVILWISVALTLWALADYTYKGIRAIRAQKAG